MKLCKGFVSVRDYEIEKGIIAHQDRLTRLDPRPSSVWKIMSKGSAPRPFDVDRQAFENNWDAIFGKRKSANNDDQHDDLGKRVRKIKPYPAIPTEVKDYFLEPSDVDDMAVVDVVLIAVALCFIAGFAYGLLLGAIR
jgi:hypothetical protein